MKNINPLGILSIGGSITTDEPIDVINHWISETPGDFKPVKSSTDKYTIIRIEKHGNSIRRKVFKQCKELLPFNDVVMDLKYNYVRVLVTEWNRNNSDNLKVSKNGSGVKISKPIDSDSIYSVDEIETIKNGFNAWISEIEDEIIE